MIKAETFRKMIGLLGILLVGVECFSAESGDLHTPPSNYVFSPELSVAVPQPLNLGVEVYQGDQINFKFYLDAGYFQYPLSSSASFQFSIASIETGMRYSPYNNWWYLSLGMGFRNIRVMTTRISSFKIEDEVMATAGILGLSTFYFSPMLEARVSLSKSASVSFGVGVQISVFASGNLSLENSNTGANSDNSSTLAINSGTYISRIAAIIVPRVTLFRFSFDL